jgi:hypothetical protein
MAPSVEARPAPRALPVVPTTPTTFQPTFTPSTFHGEERKSNEVEGFVYKRWKNVLYTVGILLKIPLLPFWPLFIAREAKDPSLATKKYFKTLAYCLNVVVQHIRFGSFLRMIKFNLLMGPEEMKRRIAQRRGACTRCAKCCQQFDCIFLGRDEQTREFFCKVYGTDYWYYGTCGRYPLDQADIDAHACPGFSFEPQEAPAAATTPAAPQAPAA